MRGFDAKFYGPDALPDTKEQKCTGLHLFCFYYVSWRGKSIIPFCRGSQLPVPEFFVLSSYPLGNLVFGFIVI